MIILTSCCLLQKFLILQLRGQTVKHSVVGKVLDEDLGVLGLNFHFAMAACWITLGQLLLFSLAYLTALL